MRYYLGGIEATSSETLLSNSQYIILKKLSKKFSLVKLISDSLWKVFTYQKRCSPLRFFIHIILNAYCTPDTYKKLLFWKFFFFFAPWHHGREFPPIIIASTVEFNLGRMQKHQPKFDIPTSYPQQVMLRTHPWPHHFLIFWHFGVFFDAFDEFMSRYLEKLF